MRASPRATATIGVSLRWTSTMRSTSGPAASRGSGDNFDGVLYDARLRLVLVPACDGIEFDGGKAFGNGGFCVFIHLFGCGSAREEVQANFVAAVAAEEFPDRDLEVFAFDVV